MSNLKTLKNLDMASNDGLVSKENLRQEAIKHVKHLHNRAMDFGGTEDWIIYFFNITEDDLKVVNELK